jgi:hypothetical protein
MKASPLARLIVAGFIAIFVFAGAYLLLDAFGIWPRLPAPLTHGAEVLTGLILVLALLGHLALATGALPVGRTDSERGH